MTVPADVLVAGGGPAGWATARACARRGLATVLVEPRPDAPWGRTYGSWRPDLPSDLPERLVAAGGPRVAIAVHTHEIDDEYVVLDTDGLLQAHLADADVTVVRSSVAGRAENGVVLDDGTVRRAALVVDATGAAQVLSDGPGRPATGSSTGGTDRGRRRRRPGHRRARDRRAPAVRWTGAPVTAAPARPAADVPLRRAGGPRTGAARGDLAGAAPRPPARRAAPLRFHARAARARPHRRRHPGRPGAHRARPLPRRLAAPPLPRRRGRRRGRGADGAPGLGLQRRLLAAPRPADRRGRGRRARRTDRPRSSRGRPRSSPRPRRAPCTRRATAGWTRCCGCRPPRSRCSSTASSRCRRSTAGPICRRTTTWDAPSPRCGRCSGCCPAGCAGTSWPARCSASAYPGHRLTGLDRTVLRPLTLWPLTEGTRRSRGVVDPRGG